MINTCACLDQKAKRKMVESKLSPYHIIECKINGLYLMGARESYAWVEPVRQRSKSSKEFIDKYPTIFPQHYIANSMLPFHVGNINKNNSM